MPIRSISSLIVYHETAADYGGRVKLFRTATGRFVEEDGHQYRIGALTWDALLAHDNLQACLAAIVDSEAPTHEFHGVPLIAPIEGQEVWAAGVTYYRSRGARMEESKDAGGGDFYDRVYSAERPELFFKSAANRTVGHGGKVRIRKDAHWSVPEPELTLVDQSPRKDHRLHHRQRHELARHRGREPSLPSPGQGL